MLKYIYYKKTLTNMKICIHYVYIYTLFLGFYSPSLLHSTSLHFVLLL